MAGVGGHKKLFVGEGVQKVPPPLPPPQNFDCTQSNGLHSYSFITISKKLGLCALLVNFIEWLPSLKKFTFDFLSVLVRKFYSYEKFH